MSRLPVYIANALGGFCRELRAKMPENIVEIRLFGSAAKGNAAPDSDIDLLIVLKNKDELAKKLH